MVFPPELVQRLDRLETELRAGVISDENRQWLAGCGLTPEQMAAHLEPLPEPERTLHLYHCDHRGLPLALISPDGTISWYAEYDEWGNVLREDNPHNLDQELRLPGQQYDDESGLHYNRHRYYNPLQGRYITQDPTGLEGGWNAYLYPLNPISYLDPLGLKIVVEGDRGDFETAIKYLKQDAEMKKIITAMENDKHTVVVSCNSKYDNSFTPATMRIHWDPKSALLCDGVPKDGKYDFENGSQVPAVGLGHEIAHAYAYAVEETSDYMRRVNTPDPSYGNAEEKRVITGVEKHAAKTLNQCIRKDHGGLPYHVQSPVGKL